MCSMLLGRHCFRFSQLTEQGNVCIYQMVTLLRSAMEGYVLNTVFLTLSINKRFCAWVTFSLIQRNNRVHSFMKKKSLDYSPLFSYLC